MTARILEMKAGLASWRMIASKWPSSDALGADGLSRPALTTPDYAPPDWMGHRSRATCENRMLGPGGSQLEDAGSGSVPGSRPAVLCGGWSKSIKLDTEQ